MTRNPFKGLLGALSNARETDFHLVRTSDGWASVFTTTGDQGQVVRVLDVGGAFQSATYLGEDRFELAFAYYRAFDVAFAVNPLARRVLMLGGGGCAWPKHAAATHPDLVVDVIEKDPRIIDIARRWFFAAELEAPTAHRGCLNLIAADGRDYLERTDVVYDAILNDTFVGEFPVRSLATVEAARAVAKRLAPKGIYLSNVVSNDGGADVTHVREAVGALLEMFPHVAVIPCPDQDFSDEDNYLIAASMSPFTIPEQLPFDEDFPLPPLYDRRD